MDLVAWEAALREALLSSLKVDDFDIVLGEDGAELEVMTDDWTLHVEAGPPAVAWLALDVEPESAEEAHAARGPVMSTAIDAALARADARLGGALATALAAADDLLSADLVAAIKGS